MEVVFCITLFSLIFIIFILCQVVIKKQNDFFKIRGIAYIKPKIFFGNYGEGFMELEEHENFLKYFFDYFKTEKIYGIFNFLRPTIIIKDLNIAKQITVDYHHKFLDRDKCVEDAILMESLYNSKGNKWRSRRKLMESYFSSASITSWQKEQIDANVQILIRALEEGSKNGKIRNIKPCLKLFLGSIAAKIILGLGSECEEESMFILKMYEEIEDNLTSLKGKFKMIISTYFPWTSKIFQIRIINQLVIEYFEELVMEKTNNFKDSDENSFSNFIVKNSFEATGGEISHKQIGHQILAFMIDAYFITLKSLEACCYELGMNEKTQDELILNSKEDSVLIKNFIFETLRKWSLIPNITRKCNQNCSIESKNRETFKFYDGDLIKIPIRLLNNDNKIFLDPLSFDVHRFNERNEPAIFFGMGYRSCVCSNYALLQIEAVITEILKNYRIYSEGNAYRNSKTLIDFSENVELKRIIEYKYN